MVFAAKVVSNNLPVETTLICTPLHCVVSRQLRNLVYAVVSPGQVPYSAQMILLSVVPVVLIAPVMKLSLSHREAQSISASSVVLCSKWVAK